MTLPDMKGRMEVSLREDLDVGDSTGAGTGPAARIMKAVRRERLRLQERVRAMEPMARSEKIDHSGAEAVDAVVIEEEGVVMDIDDTDHAPRQLRVRKETNLSMWRAERMAVPPDKAGVDTGDVDTAGDIEAVDAVEVVEPDLNLKAMSRSVTTHTITPDRILARPLSSLSIHCSRQSKCDTIITVMCSVHIGYS